MFTWNSESVCRGELLVDLPYLGLHDLKRRIANNDGPIIPCYSVPSSLKSIDEWLRSDYATRLCIEDAADIILWLTKEEVRGVVKVIAYKDRSSYFKV